MSDRAQLSRLYDAANEAECVMTLAANFIKRGGDADALLERIEHASDMLVKAMETVGRNLSRDAQKTTN